VQVAAALELGAGAMRTGSLERFGLFFDSVIPRMMTSVATEPDEFRLLAMAAGMAPYYAGGVFCHDIEVCAENCIDIAESPRDRMYVAVARGIPSGRDIEESLALPAPYDWYTATQWCRHCHRKRALQLFEIALAKVMAGPDSEIEADVLYEQSLAECMWEDLLRTAGRSDARINLSHLLTTLPPPSTNPGLRMLRRMEVGRILRLHPWERRRHRVK
jgi:hypothetical protein